MNTRYVASRLAGLLGNIPEEGQILDVSTVPSAQMPDEFNPSAKFIIAAACLAALAAFAVFYRGNYLPRACARFSLFGGPADYESIQEDSLDQYPEAVPMTLIPKVPSAIR
jgi:hypothetical protein